MRLEQIQGNTEVCKALAGMVDSGRVPHAILFHDDDGGEGIEVSLAFLEYLMEGNPRVGKLIHPDVHFIFPTAAGFLSEQYMEQFRALATENPCFTEQQMWKALGIEGKNSIIAVNEARHLIETLSLSALEGGYRAVVIYLPERMNQEASNRLLKLIEEPPQKTQFVLLSHFPERVLLTISSRCQRIRLAPRGCREAVQFENPELFYELMDALVSRDLVSALEVSDKLSGLSSRENAKAFCKFAAERMRQIFLRQQGLVALCGPDDELDSLAGKFRRTFPRRAMEALDRTLGLIDRNVNGKILFMDLVNRLYLNI